MNRNGPSPTRNRRAKVYRLTAEGRKALCAEAAVWGDFVGAVGQALRAAGAVGWYFPSMATAVTQSTIETFRKVLLGVLIFGLVGTEIELLLLEHTDGYWQLTPVGAVGVGLVVVVWWLVARGRASLRALQTVMLLFVVCGVVGSILHYNGNVAFELEMMPGLRGVALFRKAMMGATPALAPGVMIQLGLIGWLYTFRHPVLLPSHPTLSRTSE